MIARVRTKFEAHRAKSQIGNGMMMMVMMVMMRMMMTLTLTMTMMRTIAMPMTMIRMMMITRLHDYMETYKTLTGNLARYTISGTPIWGKRVEHRSVEETWRDTGSSCHRQ